MKRYIGLDLGTRTLGVAVSDVIGIVHPRPEFRFEKNCYRLAMHHVFSLLDQEQIEDIVLGNPLNMDGSISEGSLRSERFKNALLIERPNLHIFLQDERLTTVAAETEMIQFGYSRKRRKSVIDSSAACIILEDFLSSLSRKENS